MTERWPAGDTTLVTLEETLASIRERFIEDAWTIRTANVSVHEKVRACINPARGSAQLKRAHKIVNSALIEWQENLVGQAKKYFKTLFEVAIAHPEWTGGNPVAWARSQADALWTEELDQGRDESRQWTAGEEERQRRGLPATLGAKPVRHLDWFRWVCDGPPDISRIPGSAGWDEPWRAPNWVMGKIWNRRLLTVAQTNYVLRALVPIWKVDWTLSCIERRQTGRLN